jgi:5'-nucleotidase
MRKLLIDMDGVISDYYGSFLEIWKKEYPDRIVIPASELKDFYMEKSYPEEYAEDIRRITTSVGFFRYMAPISGAVLALKSILADGKFDPVICTTPDTHVDGQLCWSEKAEWIEHYLGAEWLKRLIQTADKTMIRGDFLIDDKPVHWRRIVFDHSYNQDTSGYRLMNWFDWPRLRETL